MTERKKGFVRAHERAVKAFARQQGITKGSAYVVLEKLLERRNYKTLTAFRSREDLIEDTGYCDKTVKKAMAKLRKTGVIEAVAYEHGGRGCATVYKFRQNTEKGGSNVTPYEGSGDPDENGGTFVPKGGNKVPETGEQKTPPTTRQEFNMEGPGVAGANGEPPSRRQEAPLRPQTPEEQALFSQWERDHSYSYALTMLKDLRRRQALAAE